MNAELYLRIKPIDASMKDAFWKALENEEIFKGDSRMHLYKGDAPKEFDQLFLIRKFDETEMNHIKNFIHGISAEWDVRVRTIDKEPWMKSETYALLQSIHVGTPKRC